MIYGVDTKMRGVAISCPEFGIADSILLKPGRPRNVELAELARWFAERVPGDATVWIEDPILGGSGNVQTAVKLSMTVGAIMAVSRPGAMHQVASATWKAAVVGHGHASKDDVRRWVETRLPAHAEACAAIEDRFDATGIARYGELVAAGRVAGPGKVPRRRARRVLRAA